MLYNVLLFFTMHYLNYQKLLFAGPSFFNPVIVVPFKVMDVDYVDVLSSTKGSTQWIWAVNIHDTESADVDFSGLLGRFAITKTLSPNPSSMQHIGGLYEPSLYDCTEFSDQVIKLENVKKGRLRVVVPPCSVVIVKINRSK